MLWLLDACDAYELELLAFIFEKMFLLALFLMEDMIFFEELDKVFPHPPPLLPQPPPIFEATFAHFDATFLAIFETGLYFCSAILMASASTKSINLKFF